MGRLGPAPSGLADLRGDWDDPVLFDRESDPGERRSVADAYPGVVDDLGDAVDG